MKKYLSIALSVILLSGCAPKIGKDICIEPQGNLRWENTQTEMVLGVLSLLGISKKSGDIRLGSDLKVLNKWHSDIRIVSLTYTLTDNQEVIARGGAKTEGGDSILIPSEGQKMIPLEFRIDAKQLSSNRVLGILQSKRKLFVKGEAVIEVWGIQKHHLFEKEVTPIIQKALTGV
ncbi:MAG TPA: lipoprotein [Sulfuricurvum sp.]|nr:lipoprotein [Sulfuricurvum sp.]